VHGEDIRVVQRGGCAGFLLESTEAIDVGRKCSGEDFDRDITSESRIARTVYLAHAASAEGGDDFVGAETGAGSEGHSGWCGLYGKASDMLALLLDGRIR
jgi:hypothetical protein